MSRMYKCSVFGCKQEKGYSLHFIPEKNRAKWLRFLSGVEVTSNTRVCSRHFTPDSFENWSQYSSGFATRLKLKSTAFPTLSGTGVDDRRSILQLPSTVRHVGCQTDPPRRVSAGTQLANGTMKRSVRSSGVLAVPRTREAAVGTDRPVSRLFRELTSDPAPPVAPPPAPAHDEPGPPLPQMMIVPDVCLLNQDEQAPIEIEVELTTSITNTPSSSSQQNSQWTSQDSQNRPSVSDQEKKSWSRYGSLSKDLVRELCSSTVGTAPVSAAFRPTAQENASPSHKSVWFAAATESGPHNQLTYYERRRWRCFHLKMRQTLMMKMLMP
ncbi:uncharacterized protein LOC143474720 isoform X2 [Brachyhypopomus gauderio]|uniref:uncharacterized protein LOC143474720 isoform X2 n=1 Tax=Brachyhypopomus gauderio TaxID=698409 RepID=UPI00404371BB